MRRTINAPRIVLGAVLLAALVVPVRTLAAQGSSYADVFSGAVQSCGPSGSSSSGGANSSISCTGVASLYQGSGHGGIAGIGASTNVQSYAGASQFTFPYSIATRASGSFYDFLSFSASSLVPSAVRLNVLFQGALSASMSPGAYGTGAYVSSLLMLDAQPIWSARAQAWANPGVTAEYSGAHSDFAAINNTISLLVPLAAGDYGRVGFGFSYAVNLNSTVSQWPYGVSSNNQASGAIDASLTSISFYDQFGQEMTDGVQYSLRQGMQVTATPEPASLVLLGTGLAGIALAKYRRRRR